MLSTASKPASLYSRDSLHPYQERAVSFVKDTPKCALWMDMGLGKSVTVLTAISDLFDQFEIGRVLIIAPLRVALNTWPAEIAQWDHTRHLTSCNLAGKSKKVRERDLLLDRCDIHIINRELVEWLVTTVKTHKLDWPYDTVVIDESSSFKSPKARRFKALRKMLPQVDRMVELTLSSGR